MTKETGGSIWSHAIQLIRFSWRSLFLCDLFYKAIAFAILTPLTMLFLRWMISRTGGGVVADADIAMFFFTRIEGVLLLIFGVSVLIAITAVESASLMVIGLAADRGERVSARGALLYAVSHAGSILRVAAHMVGRILLGLIPFAVAIGAVYFFFLREHDINYYLARKPVEFWVALGMVSIIAIALVLLLLRTVARWAFALPLVLFEQVHPRRTLRESAKRTAGNHKQILLVLSGWAALGLALNTGLTILMESTGRIVGPQLSGSMTALLIFISTFVFIWIVLGVVVAIFNVSLFSALIVLLYLKSAPAADTGSAAVEEARSVKMLSASPPMLAGLIAIFLLIAGAVILIGFAISRNDQPVLVIAHRGASADAPENTLAAFRLAAAQRSDFVELDVQESRDGIVVVNHDKDLMKIGGSPMVIWERNFAELGTVDIGSSFAPSFKNERVPTLVDALAACKGSKVLVELKSYGHNDRLEERVAEIVETAGMEKECWYMSLDHSMVRKMKQLRPAWRVGLLAAKVIGDITTFGADFIAVEARMATRRFVRRAHRANQDVYVWTVDDPAWMLTAMSNGVDGLITNKPALARKVIEKRGQMTDLQRVLVALLIRLGANTASLESQDALRP